MAVGAGLLAWAAPAGATYSVVSVDTRRQHVGGAGTSCVGSLDVGVILGVAPGFGAVHAQALINMAGRDQAVELLSQGLTPEAIIEAITGASFDPAAAQRQYGVVSLAGVAAGFTGETNGAFASDRQGTVSSFTYSVQGNILTGVAVLDGAEGGFVRGGGCDMPERLILALEAGAANGEGDSRCTPDGIPADSAFLRVVDADGTVIVDLSVTDTAPQNPMVPLRAAFDAWRVDHPCPALPPGTTGGTTTGDATSTVTTSMSTSGDVPSTTTVASSSSSTSAAPVPATTSPQTGEQSGESGGGASTQPGGCGCRLGSRSHAVWLWTLGLLAVSPRRPSARSRRRAGRSARLST